MHKTITLKAPPSKSVSHRALLAAGLAGGTSVLENVLVSEDILRTRDCLAALGAKFSGDDSAPVVQGLGGRIKAPSLDPVKLDVGESGTTCRLLAAIVSAGQGSFEISGAGRMHERPIKSLGQSLEGQGVRFKYLGLDGCPPVRIESSGLPGGVVTVGLDESSQYLSGILLASTMATTSLVINIGGKKVVSWPYVHLTLQTMQRFGNPARLQTLQEGHWRHADPDQVQRVEPGKIRFVVHPGVLNPVRYRVEGDYSNASYLLAAGAVGEFPVEVSGLDLESRQGDRRILEILELMGAKISETKNGVMVSPARLHGVDLDMGTCPDLVPTVAVVASMATGTTRISNVAHLRIKESDRLAGVQQEVSRAGCRCGLKEDGLEIEPAELLRGSQVQFKTYGDHRMAMSLSLYELAGIQTALDNPACVNKSFPGFWEEWENIRRAYAGKGD
ncbi:3-phosphoshikimate 1-carboxyvinyltransferase [Desulfonatronospira sp. MSAO_Bac3]|uniref:3-phosphoshikimate 1-carboxyvinyltransferase n=1 Tax=Desulfonatronospira sp. MSAO_Bac3 TaxID=2293857 RepID=UPI000FF65676|nr:3-phosphoshikimate 1-carboxyvinyltransferase [Desulfonatronospira sp. MSAO_Bac3]RQD76862.1 MAG: 3-phosphoshikimate 1-carboxyvinyltransferase [Desulfonatronospira sp. MSAO_Bac3]